jgi:hypothetical protein
MFTNEQLDALEALIRAVVASDKAEELPDTNAGRYERAIVSQAVEFARMDLLIKDENGQ